MSEEPVAKVIPSDDFPYYSGRYWNNQDQVVRELNLRATGDPDVPWQDHLQKKFGTFDRALILNCGNGWVERELIEKGVVRSAVGVDFSSDLLGQAARQASELGMRLEYEQLDTNTAKFPEGPFDLVVNHAALHHVAYLDRVARRLCEILSPDGVLVSWDYVGSHRNQYSGAQWEAAWRVNLELPEEIRQNMRYPHLPTMLATDPTEAVHAELILPTLKRYFRYEHFRHLGGGVGYLLLTHNDALHSRPVGEIAEHVEMVMRADAALLEKDPESSLFAYWVSRPDPDRVTDPGQLESWTAEEDRREAAAGAAGGVYYPPTAVGALSEALSAAELAHAQALAAAQNASTPAPGPPPVASPVDRDAVIAATPGRELLIVALSRLQARAAARIGSWRQRRVSR